MVAWSWGRRSWRPIACATVFLLILSLGRSVRGPVGSSARLDPATLEPRGYSGDVGRPFEYGVWRGVATTVSSVGYSNDGAGRVIVRKLKFEHPCSAGGCQYSVLRELRGEAPERAQLVREADGWHASFPIRYYSCGKTPTGKWISWPQRTTMIFRFGVDSQTFEARERSYSWAAGCGYGTAEVQWRGWLAES
jgi:hypothetical protein